MLGVGGVGSLAGCAGDEGAGDAPDEGGTAPDASAGRSVGGTYREALSTDAKSLNLLFQSDGASAKFIGATMDTAYDFRSVDEIVPLWVESYSETEKREWTFTLRDGLRWSDPYGDLTAEDWVYTAQNVYGAKAPGESKTKENWAGAVQYADWKDLTVEKLGKRTLRVTLPSPEPAFLASTAFWGGRCLPRGLVEGYVEDGDAEGLKRDEELNRLSYTGNLGPYDFEEWARESRFVATRAEEYYVRDAADTGDIPERFADAPYFERYELRILPEQSTRLSALREGELTFYENVPAQKVERYREMDHLKFRFPPNPLCSAVYYNQRPNGWEMLRRTGVRRALSTAVSKRAIAENVYRGYPTVAQTFQPEWSPWYSADRIEPFGVGDGYGAERARRMLSEALSDTEYGYDGDELVDGSGEQVELTFVYRDGREAYRTTAEFVAQELSKVGVAVAPTNGGPFNALQGKYMLNEADDGTASFNAGPNATSERPWDLLYGVTMNTYPINPDATSVIWNADGGFNFSGYEPEAPLSDLYAAARRATDDDARAEAFADIFGALNAEQPANFLQFDAYKNAYLKEYAGMPEKGEYGYLDEWDEVTWYRSDR